jgi:hypothetical protein
MARGKIGILIPGQNGDVMSAMSVLKYKDILWPEKDIVWYCNLPFAEVLKYAPVEIRHWPNGWMLPERCLVDGPLDVAKGFPNWEDWSALKTKDNKLDQKLKYNFESIKDLEEGYFAAPHQMSLEQRANIDYPNCSRKVFGVDPSWEWHPFLSFSDEEREMVKDFCSKLPHKRTVMIETFFGSGVNIWTDQLTKDTMTICRNRFGSCNFIFCSHNDNSRFFDDPGVVSCSHFSVRQTALVNNYSDLFIGISSGISVAVNCWGNKPTPKIQYTGSFIGSTKSLANGPFELIETDYNKNPVQEFKTKLVNMLHKMDQ